MKYKDIYKMTTDEAEKKFNSLKKDLFNLRFKKINSQVQDTSQFLRLRRDLAKVLTKKNRKKKND